MKVELLEISCRNLTKENCYQRDTPTSEKGGKYKSVQIIYVETHLASGWDGKYNKLAKLVRKKNQLRTMRDERECRD